MRYLLLLFLGSIMAYAADGEVSKYSYEAIDISLDFINRLNTSPITLVSVVATDSSRTNVTSTIVADSPAPAVSGSKIVARVKNGTSGADYSIVFKITKDLTGEALEGVITLHILRD